MVSRPVVGVGGRGRRGACSAGLADRSGGRVLALDGYAARVLLPGRRRRPGAGRGVPDRPPACVPTPAPGRRQRAVDRRHRRSCWTPSPIRPTWPPGCFWPVHTRRKPTWPPPPPSIPIRHRWGGGGNRLARSAHLLTGLSTLSDVAVTLASRLRDAPPGVDPAFRGRTPPRTGPPSATSPAAERCNCGTRPPES